MDSGLSAPPGPVRRAQSARGRHRREALITAAADLLLEEGISAVTHRAVATRAAVPLAATTYYFASLQDLLHQALGQLARQWIERAADAVRNLPPRLDDAWQLAHAVVGVVTGGGPATDPPAEHLIAMYERYLEAGRHPRLRPLVVAYNEQLTDLVQEVLRRGGLPWSRPDARLVLAVVDGALITALAEGQPAGRSAAASLAGLVGQVGSTRGQRR